MVIEGHVVLEGRVEAPVVWSRVPLSFWGGVAPESGKVVDRHHPLSGRILSSAVLMIPGTRGSSTSSGILLEMIRRGTAPAAIITTRVDPVLALGSLIGQKLYQRWPALLVVGSEEFEELGHYGGIRIQDGLIETIGRPGTVFEGGTSQ